MKAGPVALLLLLAACGLTAAQETISPGKIIDHVEAGNDKTQSYSLYLPSKFDGKSKFPIIYAFDPGGRGKTAVEVFAEAAEKYGYIVVGSNDSRNGLGGDKLTPIFNNIWEDTHRRFSVDDGRVVMTGFSGGARVASIFGYACRCAFAVVGSGAGFSQTIGVTDKPSFVYFGTAGYDDLNYFELRSLSEKLAAVQAAYRVEFFEGAHRWMPIKVAEDALEWVELHAIRVGRRPKDPAFVDRLFEERTAAAHALLASKKFVEAEASFRSITADFAGLKDTGAAAGELRKLYASSEFQKALRAEKNEAAEYGRRSEELFRLAQNLKSIDTRQENLSQIRTIANGMRKRAEAKEDSASRRTARRLLDGVYIYSVETASAVLDSRTRTDNAMDLLELADAMRPRNAYVSYLRALLFASGGQKKRALEALSRAVEFGLKDRPRVEGDKRFDSMRNTPEFQSILAKM